MARRAARASRGALLFLVLPRSTLESMAPASSGACSRLSSAFHDRDPQNTNKDFKRVGAHSSSQRRRTQHAVVCCVAAAGVRAALVYAETRHLDAVIAHLTRECGGNVHKKGFVKCKASSCQHTRPKTRLILFRELARFVDPLRLRGAARDPDELLDQVVLGCKTMSRVLDPQATAGRRARTTST